MFITSLPSRRCWITCVQTLNVLENKELLYLNAQFRKDCITFSVKIIVISDLQSLPHFSAACHDRFYTFLIAFHRSNYPSRHHFIGDYEVGLSFYLAPHRGIPQVEITALTWTILNDYVMWICNNDFRGIGLQRETSNKTILYSSSGSSIVIAK